MKLSDILMGRRIVAVEVEPLDGYDEYNGQELTLVLDSGHSVCISPSNIEGLYAAMDDGSDQHDVVMR